MGNRYTFRVAAVNEMGQSEWLEADGEVLAKDPWGNYTDPESKQLTFSIQTLNRIDLALENYDLKFSGVLG